MASSFAVLGVDAGELVSRDHTMIDVVENATPPVILSDKHMPIPRRPPIRKQQVTVSSNDRDEIVYPNIYSYKVKLRTPLERVVGIKLTAATILTAEYVINEYNNKLDILIGESATDITTFTVPVGYYNAVTFCTELQQQLRTNGSLASASVTFTELMEKVTITSGTTTKLSFRFGSGTNRNTSLGPLLGFSSVNTEFATSLTSNGHLDMSGPNIVNLWIEEFKGVNENQPIARIPLSGNPQTMLPGDMSTVSYVGTSWKRPIGHVDELTISFRVPRKTIAPSVDTTLPGAYSDLRVVMCDRPYLFHGLQHSLVFEFDCVQVDW